jgi:hypothetical protein
MACVTLNNKTAACIYKIMNKSASTLSELLASPDFPWLFLCPICLEALQVLMEACQGLCYEHGPKAFLFKSSATTLNYEPEEELLRKD